LTRGEIRGAETFLIQEELFLLKQQELTNISPPSPPSFLSPSSGRGFSLPCSESKIIKSGTQMNKLVAGILTFHPDKAGILLKGEKSKNMRLTIS